MAGEDKISSAEVTNAMTMLNMGLQPGSNQPHLVQRVGDATTNEQEGRSHHANFIFEEEERCDIDSEENAKCCDGLKLITWHDNSCALLKSKRLRGVPL